MSLKAKLMDDLKVAMREKQVARKSTITMLRAAIKQVEVDKRVELDDESIVEIVAKQIKQKRSAIDEFTKGERQDLADEALMEIELLMAYMPEQLSLEEVSKLVQETINEVGAQTMKDMGKVMGVLQPKVKGVADGKTVSNMVKELLK